MPAVQRSCDLCLTRYEANHPSSRFCSGRCRTAWKRGKRPTTIVPAAALSQPPSTASTHVSEALERELRELGVAQSYEGVVALGLARQLDNGTITGTAYVSLSKELDRRVESLRVKAERPEDPARAAKDAIAEQRAQLRLA